MAAVGVRRAPRPSPSRSPRTSCSPTGVVLPQDGRCWHEDRADVRRRSSSFISADLSRHGACSVAARCSISTSRCTNCPRRKAAYLAALRHRTITIPSASAIARRARNDSLDRMAGTTTSPRGGREEEQLKVTPRPTGAHFAAEYFAGSAPLRHENYTEKLYEAASRCAPQLDPKMRVLARKVVEGLVFRRAAGLCGPVNKLDMTTEWGSKLADIKALSDIGPWRLAVVLGVKTAPPASACSPGANRAAQSPRSARPACFRSKA